MKDPKDQLRDTIVKITAEKLAPQLTRDSSFSHEEAVQYFIKLVELGRIKIGIMPFKEDGEEQIQSMTFIKASPEEGEDEYIAIDSGKKLKLDSETNRVFTLSLDQYREIFDGAFDN